MRTIPASRNKKSCLGPVLLTNYDFGSIQFSGTFMSDGYFHVFLKDKNVSEISIDPSSELIVSVPNTDK